MRPSRLVASVATLALCFSAIARPLAAAEPSP